MERPEPSDDAEAASREPEPGAGPSSGAAPAADTGSSSGPGASSGGDAAEGPAGGPDRQLEAGKLERVIRRAAELQFSAAEAADEPLRESEVVRIGEEVGIEPRHVRRALAEVRAESLVPDLPEDAAAPRSLWGRALVRTSRVVPGDRREVQRKLERHFRTRESLSSVRRRVGRSLWEPAGSLLSKMQRSLDLGGRGYELAEARTVELSVSELEPGWSLVTLTADLRNVRRQQAVAWTAGSVPFFLAAALVAELVLGVPWIVTGPVAGGGVLATGTWGAGRSLDRKRRRVGLVMDGLLDRLEQRRPLGESGVDWRKRLLG